MTKFRQNRLTLKGRSAGQRHTDKPVGFYGPIALPVTKAPSSECLQFGMPPSFDRCTPPRRRFNQNIPPSVVLLQQCHCRNRHRDKLQNLPPPSVLFESSRIFLQYTGNTDAKRWTITLKFEFCDFLDFFFEIFKKASRSLCGRSGPLWSWPN